MCRRNFQSQRLSQITHNKKWNQEIKARLKLEELFNTAPNSRTTSRHRRFKYSSVESGKWLPCLKNT